MKAWEESAYALLEFVDEYDSLAHGGEVLVVGQKLQLAAQLVQRRHKVCRVYRALVYAAGIRRGRRSISENDQTV